MLTQEHCYIGFHSSCASADEKHANYEAGEAASAVNSLRESYSGTILIPNT
jgi:hypothetical protein